LRRSSREIVDACTDLAVPGRAELNEGEDFPP
jgi:hypothetical protein